MTDSELTLSVLREIRDSIRTLDTNLSARIDQTNARIEALDSRLTARIDVMNERVSVIEHTLVEADAQRLLMTRYLKNRTEVEIEDLRERVTTLEKKLG